MTGSARTARCSGRTVTQPPSAHSPNAAMASAMMRAVFIFVVRGDALPGSEINTEASLVDLRVTIRVFGKYREVVGLESDEDSQAQGEQDPRAGPGRPNRLALKDELVGVGKRRQAAQAERSVRLDGPVGRKVDGEGPAIEKLVAVLGEGHADVRLEADGRRQNEGRLDLEVAVPGAPRDFLVEDPSEDCNAAPGFGERRRREKARCGRA